MRESKFIIGIDADVHRVAYAALDRGAVRAVGTIERTDYRGRIIEDYDARLMALMRRAKNVGAVVYLEGIYLAVRTGPGSKRNVDSFRKLSEVAGEIKRAARQFGVKLDTVQPSTWQSKVLPGVRGRDDLKQAAIALAQEKWRRPLSSHESDAVCVAIHGFESGKAKHSKAW